MRCRMAARSTCAGHRLNGGFPRLLVSGGPVCSFVRPNSGKFWGAAFGDWRSAPVLELRGEVCCGAPRRRAPAIRAIWRAAAIGPAGKK